MLLLGTELKMKKDPPKSATANRSALSLKVIPQLVMLKID